MKLLIWLAILPWAKAAAVIPGCGGTVTEPGNITSPKIPRETVCEWTIIPPIGKDAKIKLLHFDIPSCKQLKIDEKDYIYPCSCGQLDVKTEHGNIYTEACNEGKNQDKDPQGAYPEIRIMLQSDRYEIINPFQVEVEFVDSRCGGLLSDLKGVIRSPNYPDSYADSQLCKYEIRINDPSYVLVVDIKHFELNQDSEAPCDDSLLIQFDDCVEDCKLCANTPNAVGTRAGKGPIAITFRSGYLSEQGATGFELSYDVYKCGGSVTTNQQIGSPFYGIKNYPPNAKCIWEIKAPHGQIAQLRFKTFDVPECYSGYCKTFPSAPPQPCQCDYVSVYKGNECNETLGPYCGDNWPSHPIEGQNLKVEFSSDKLFNFNGFQASVVFNNQETKESSEP